MAQRADQTKRRLLARTEDELDGRGQGGPGQLRDRPGRARARSQLLDQALPPAARPWADPGLAGLGAARGGRRVGHAGHGAPGRLRAPRPARRGHPGAAAGHRRPGRAVRGRGVAGRGGRGGAQRWCCACWPRCRRARPGSASSTRRAWASPSRPSSGWPSTTPSWSAGGALTLDTEIEEHLAELAHHVERVTTQHLQGRYAIARRAAPVDRRDRRALPLPRRVRPPDRVHRTGPGAAAGRGGVRAALRGDRDRGQGGVGSGALRADKGIPGLPVVKGRTRRAGHGRRSGPARWSPRARRVPGSDRGRARRAHAVRAGHAPPPAPWPARPGGRPATTGAVFDLLAQAQRRRIRVDVAATSGAGGSRRAVDLVVR